jgi:hypothetical protein
MRLKFKGCGSLRKNRAQQNCEWSKYLQMTDPLTRFMQSAFFGCGKPTKTSKLAGGGKFSTTLTRQFLAFQDCAF